ncbi:inositol monophosphatase family protein [Halocatena salina]|uniref:fructose-bisphosphatase n=1 Tax=Halocatena salina TaxID=2934340 RepID=A0A8U0A4Z8_9EURY|nr:inositol monophosphatase [Halocatena salina]UPM43538.1 inositol monophosphatase [Halocatena salina]
MVDAERRVTVARRAANAGANVAMESFRTDIAVETKAHETDPVTQADRDTQDRVASVLTDAYPGEVIVGEERGTHDTVPDRGAAWVIDPIDGTSNYIRGVRTWATSVACVVDGECVAAANVFPALDDTYIAGPDGITRNDTPITVSTETEPNAGVVSPTLWGGASPHDEFITAVGEAVEMFGDLRRSGCTQGSLSRVASGGLDVAISTVDHHPWDTIAGAFMVERAGGTVTDVDGNRWRYDAPGLVATNGRLHEEALDVVHTVD